MFRLLYVSTATGLKSKDDLLEILAQAREKNARLGVTGMLLYKDGNFMQLLEGEEGVVRQLYDTITRDRRHFDSMVLMDEPVEGRMFDRWTMGFRDLSDPELQAQPGFTPFRQLDFASHGAAVDVAACLEILDFFKESR